MGDGRVGGEGVGDIEFGEAGRDMVNGGECGEIAE